MLAEERHNRIVTLLRQNGTLRTAQLVALLGVSRETIRRDLEDLSDRGVIRRIHGGAAATAAEPPWSLRLNRQVEAKRAIGVAAAALIQDGQAVTLDLGTTCLEVARNLHGKRDLTVVTNSLPAAVELVKEDAIRVYVLGGRLRPGDLSLSGPIAQRAVQQHFVDHVIIGAGGLTLDNGVTDYHVEEAEVRRQMIAQGRNLVVVADHTKFGETAFTAVAGTRDIDVLVTDDGAPEDMVAAFREAGVEVIVVRVRSGG